MELVQVTKTGKKRDRREFTEAPVDAECIDLDDLSSKSKLGPVQATKELCSFFTLTPTGSLSHITFPQLKQLTIQSKLEARQSVPLLLTERMHQQHMRACLFNEHPIAQIEGVGGLSQVVSVSDDACLLIGGVCDGGALNSVYKISITGHARLKNPMQQPRAHFGCCFSKHDNKVVVVGGQISGLAPDTHVLTTQRCEIYDVATDEWTELAALSQPLISCSVIVVKATRANKSVESDVFCFGGI